MKNQKGNAVILIVLAFFAVTLILFKIQQSPQNLLQSFDKHLQLFIQNPIDKNGLNEDLLSQKQVPADVISALNQAKQSGKPVLGIRADGPDYQIPILMYHYVEHVKDSGDKIRISLNTLPEVLDQQIKTLVDNNYNFITASDLADILDGIKPLPNKPVMLTFDDGYRDFYTDAFPILKKYNVKAVNYVISGFINKPNNLTDEQLQEIAKSGLVEIGAHSVDHLALAGISQEKQAFEIAQSKVQLEQKLEKPVTAFAYPYGSFDISAIQIAKQSGFRSAVSTIDGKIINNSVRFFAYRIRPGLNTGQSLLKLLQ